MAEVGAHCKQLPGALVCLARSTSEYVNEQLIARQQLFTSIDENVQAELVQERLSNQFFIGIYVYSGFVPALAVRVTSAAGAELALIKISMKFPYNLMIYADCASIGSTHEQLIAYATAPTRMAQVKAYCAALPGGLAGLAARMTSRINGQLAGTPTL